ncbi:uncharacterized protein LOC111336750 [Stylophora pistillata]|nr:uncharacterized protein LOC111336750 [Stylophora pistillata]
MAAEYELSTDEKQHTANAYANASSLEVRSSSRRIDCRQASFRRHTLYDYLYTYNCVPSGWSQFFGSRTVRGQIQRISESLESERAIEPSLASVFNAFSVSAQNVKVVILGQDPTPQANRATGFAFSLRPGEEPSGVPAVFNVLVELGWEGYRVDLSNGDLTPWVRQGVFLLNAALTVRQGSAGSHQRIWRTFMEHVLQEISSNARPTAWILWGREAQGARRLIARNHYVKTGGHPAQRTPGSDPFFGRNYFRCANQFLRSNGRGEVDWRLGENRHSQASTRASC